MTVRIVVGAQWGDEAKGKITDYLASDARYVVRTGGGPNAGHTIRTPEGMVVLHQLPCGVLRHGVVGICGPGMVLQPVKLLDEIRELEEKDRLRGDLLISDRAHVILPLHEVEDAWDEELRSAQDPAGSVGTTRRGIGPAYSDRYGRWGIRIGDLDHPATLRARLALLYARKKHLSGLPSIDEVAASLTDAGERLAPLVRTTEPILWKALENRESILLEGAQGTMLDIDFGTYPFLTSSHPTSTGSLLGSGLPPQSASEIIGVAKAYATRVGAGPFPTEITGEEAELLQRTGGEHGATTGRLRRVGWLDLVMLRYAARLNGFTSLALAKVDVLAGREEIPICVSYRTPEGGEIRDVPPSSAEVLARVGPVYERLAGWPKFHPHLEERLRREGASALPAPLRRFVEFVGRETGVPIEFLSYGPERDATLRLRRAKAGNPRSLSPWPG